MFNRLADAYRHRPSYPPELIDRLAALAGGGPVVDLGAGTGLIAVPLAKRGLEVHAVEPAQAMLDVLLERDRAGSGRVHLVHAAAEETGLPTRAVRFAVIADALHWVDPELTGREVARVIAPGGTVAVIESIPANTPLMTELEAHFARFNPRAQRAPARGALEQLMRLAGATGSLQVEAFTQQLSLDPQALEGIVRSYSFAGPALGESALRELLEAVARTLERHGDAQWTRVLRLTWGTVQHSG
ncbi:MAG: class I SAM-dependent methyltransferase [Myxococcaceae bacterium]